ncbi:uncharacterized protein [Haliotis asinina]|uniref:uncharacterized protein n=1 Tax=Haliotis asinina TaxID=109174 RepID=UPI0035318AE8
MTVIIMLSFILTYMRPVQLFCFNETSVIEDGFYLENSLFDVTVGRVVVRECAFECYAHSGCSSFGFEPGLHLCHLHKENSSTTKLSRKQRWKHSDVSWWPKELMGPCADHTCPSGRRCSVHRVTKAPLCLEGSIYQPDICSDEPIPNATCSSESKLAGSVRSCTCHTNYRDVPLDVVSVNNTCMVNGSWTPPFINCTGMGGILTPSFNGSDNSNGVEGADQESVPILHRELSPSE